MHDPEPITVAGDSDRPRIFQVWEASVRATHDFLTESDLEFIIPRAQKALETYTPIHVLRDPAGDVYAFMGVSGACVDMLFVHPDHRGNGAGRALMEYAIRELGASEVDVSEQNTAARGFYEHLGFRVVGRSPLDPSGRPIPVLHMRRESRPLVLCADIGSVAKGRFGWASRRPDGSEHTGREIEGLVREAAEGLFQNSGVTLGFECPLFVPMVEDPMRLTSARQGEGSRPWSAGAGAGVLAIGLTEVVWILRAIRKLAPDGTEALLEWPAGGLRAKHLFLWEAFVSGSNKGKEHTDDAAAAVRTFCHALSRRELASCVTVVEAYSLVGAALLRTGWSNDVGLLSRPCVVIKGQHESGHAR